MKTFQLILAVVFFGLGVRGIITGLVHGAADSFLLYTNLQDNLEMYANILFIIISFCILGLVIQHVFTVDDFFVKTNKRSLLHSTGFFATLML